MVSIPAVRVQHDTDGAIDPEQDTALALVSESYLALPLNGT